MIYISMALYLVLCAVFGFLLFINLELLKELEKMKKRLIELKQTNRYTIELIADVSEMLRKGATYEKK